MPYEEPVLVRNLRPGVTVLDPEQKNTGIEWQAKGDPNGGDIIPVPPSIANTISFSRAIRRNILEVVTQEEADSALRRQQEKYLEAKNSREKSATELIDRDSNREIASKPCVGPQDRGNGKCEILVVVESEDQAPLCTKHKHLRSQFVEREDWSSGKKVVLWDRVVLGEREVAPSTQD